MTLITPFLTVWGECTYFTPGQFAWSLDEHGGQAGVAFMARESGGRCCCHLLRSTRPIRSRGVIGTGTIRFTVRHCTATPPGSFTPMNEAFA